ncbi:MAG: leucine-rich repeat protein [Coriobacteriales bacterium]|jgi:UDP-N-acetylmuramoyl-tripeptide--D-alanyl-D-alanine ligase|nr:leucine-rich repeat protein [Coriobacteriales bacterium]
MSSEAVYAVKPEDIAGCRLLVLQGDVRNADALDFIERFVTEKPKRHTKRILVLGNVLRLDNDPAAVSEYPDCKEISRAILAAKKSISQLICADPSVEVVGNAAAKAGMAVSFAYTHKSLSVTLADICQQKGLIGVCFASTPWIPLAIDSTFNTVLIAESDEGLEKYAIKRKVSFGTYALISGFGAILLKWPTTYHSVSLPTTVTGMGIVAIGRSALYGTKVCSVVLHAPLRSIGQAAFYRCACLSKLILPATLEYIGRSAFAKCSALKKITIPEGCKTIGRNAFKDCTALAHISIPASVESIGYQAFAKCATNLVLIVDENSYAEKWAASHSFDYVLRTPPEEVQIVERQFAYNGLVYNALPGRGLEVVDYAPRRKAKRIRSFLPGNLMEIIQSAPFRKAASLIVPTTVLGKDVVGIGMGAFANNERLTSVTLPKRIKWIAPRAFKGCSALQVMVFPPSLELIGNEAFADCPKIVENSLFTFVIAKTFATITQYHGREPEVIVPSYIGSIPVTGIQHGAFKGCTFLQSITLPETLEKIATEAFAETNLKSLTIPASVGYIGNRAIPDNACLNVESDSYAWMWAGLRNYTIGEVWGKAREEGVSGDHEAAVKPQPYRPFFAHQYLTIEKLCEIIDAPVPEKLTNMKSVRLPGVNAYWAIAQPYEAYFDLLNEPKEIEGAAQKKPFLMVLPEPFAGDTNEVPVIVHPNPPEAFQEVCRWRLSNYPNLKKVGIGGSQGKSSMKDMVATVLSDSFKTLKSAGNTNTFNALDHALRRLSHSHRFYIQELGAGGHFGRHIQYGAKALQPHYSILTNTRDNHLETYETVENLLEAKASLVREMDDAGVAFLNADDEMLWNYKSSKRIVYYGIENKQADYRAQNITTHDGYTTFSITYAKGTVAARINVVGAHNVYNALAAFALGDVLGIERKKILSSMAKFVTSGMRQNYTTIGGYRMLIDCYNSSPDSVKQCLKTISEIPLPETTRRIVVLGDILELGEAEVEKHRDIGYELLKYQNSVDYIFCYGSLMEHAGEIARQAGMKVFCSSDRDELNRTLSDVLEREDLILWKASHGMRLFLSIDQLFGTSFDINDQTTVNDFGDRLALDYGQITTLPGQAQIDEWLSTDIDLELPSTINGEPVTSIGKNAFLNTDSLRSIIIPSTVRHIGLGAFFQVSNLTKVVLTQGLILIDRSAFNGCSLLTEVTIPDTCLHIGKLAFYNCMNLERVRIPMSVGAIAKDAFLGCPNLVIIGSSGSYAEEYAKAQGIEFAFDDTLIGNQD